MQGQSGTLLKLLLAGVAVFILYKLFSKRSASSMLPVPYDEGYEEDDSDDDEGYTDDDSDDSDDEGYTDADSDDDEEGYGPMDQTYGTVTPAGTVASLASARPDLPGVNVATDLLPKPAMTQSDFAEFAPAALSSAQFLDSTAFIGVDTVGSSLKNANYQLRADIPIPKVSVGPWLASSIEAGDLARKPLE